MRQTSFIISLAGLLLSACSQNDNNLEKNASNAITVKVSTVKNQENTLFLAASGKVEAVENATLSTRTMGYIKKIHAEVGSKVSKNQLLVSITSTDLNAQSAQANAGISEAQAAFSNAEKNYNRFKKLFKSKSASQKELDDVATNYNMAKARLEAAQQMKNSVNAQFKYSNIRAPFSGIITQKMANTGDMANPGMPLLQIENPKTLQIVAMVPESEISQIKQGDKVKVLVKAVNKTYEGRITAISASAQNTGGQYLVKISLPKKSNKLLAGMFATVQFPTSPPTPSPTITIPTSILINKGELTGIYTVSQSGTAILRWLRLGNTYGDHVEVLSGLSAGETYILSAGGKLYNGVKIKVQ